MKAYLVYALQAWCFVGLVWFTYQAAKHGQAYTRGQLKTITLAGGPLVWVWFLVFLVFIKGRDNG